MPMSCACEESQLAKADTIIPEKRRSLRFAQDSDGAGAALASPESALQPQANVQAPTHIAEYGARLTELERRLEEERECRTDALAAMERRLFGKYEEAALEDGVAATPWEGRSKVASVPGLRFSLMLDMRFKSLEERLKRTTEEIQLLLDHAADTHFIELAKRTAHEQVAMRMHGIDTRLANLEMHAALETARRTTAGKVSSLAKAGLHGSSTMLDEVETKLMGHPGSHMSGLGGGPAAESKFGSAEEATSPSRQRGAGFAAAETKWVAEEGPGVGIPSTPPTSAAGPPWPQAQPQAELKKNLAPPAPP